MTKFVRHSRIRRFVNATLAVAMVMSMVAMPAYAAEPSLPSALNAGPTAFTSVTGECGTGIDGLVTVTSSITVGAYARQDSAVGYSDPTTVTLSSQAITAVNSGNELHIRVASQRYNSLMGIAWTGVPSVDATDVVISGITPASTVKQLVDAINTKFAGLVIENPSLSEADKVLAKNAIMIDAKFLSGVSGQISLQKRFAEADSFVWAEDHAAPGAEPKGVADAIFGGQPAVTDFGFDFRNSQFTTGTAPTSPGWGDASLGATVTPDNGAAYPLMDSDLSWGHVANGTFVDDVEPTTGQFTAVEIDSQIGDQSYFVLTTGNPSVSVQTGTATFRIGGDRDCFPDPTTDPFTITQTEWEAGQDNTVTATFSNSVSPWNAVNGARMYLPAGFVVSTTKTATSTAGHPTAPLVTTTAMSDGRTMVEVTGFVDNDSFTIEVYGKNPTKSNYMGGEYPVVFEVRNVGTTLDDWCAFCDTMDEIYVNAENVIKSVVPSAAGNRAGGYTRVATVLLDQYQNHIVEYTHTLAYAITNQPTGGTPGSLSFPSWSGVGPYDGNNAPVWTLSTVEGTQTVTVTVDGVHSAPVAVGTAGVGTPVKVVIVPFQGDTVKAIGESQRVYLQLVDANGNSTSFLDGDYSYWVNRDFYGDDDYRSTSTFNILNGWSTSNRNRFNLTSAQISGASNAAGIWEWTAEHVTGRVAPSPVLQFTVLGATAGVPYRIVLTANKVAPAAYATDDDIYNNRGQLGFAREAFGYAEAKVDGSEVIVYTAQIVDAYGTPVTTDASGTPLTFTVPANPYSPGAMPGGGPLPDGARTYTIRADSTGKAVVPVRSWKGSENAYRGAPFDLNDGNAEGYSWFTPIHVTAMLETADPCDKDPDIEGYGFAYFYRGVLEGSLEKDLEGMEKTCVLANGQDSTKFTAWVTDPCFGTGVANWPVTFTTNFGTIDGTQTINTKTGADGTVSVTVQGSEAGSAQLIARDEDRTRIFRNVEFTKYQLKSETLQSGVQGGNAAKARVRMWVEDLAGVRQYFDATAMPSFSPVIYRRDADGKPVITGGTVSNIKVVTEVVGGKTLGSAIEFDIPAYDSNTDYSVTLDASGERWARIAGISGLKLTTCGVFYDQASTCFVVRPAVNFVNNANVDAEGTHLTTGISVVGSGFTPAASLSRIVDLELWDGSKWIELGEAWVGNDGTLLPVAASTLLSRLSPGAYDIKVDGLVFADKLMIKPLFSNVSTWLQDYEGFSGGVYYLKMNKNYSLNVGAYGASDIEVWVGNTKLVKSATTGMFTLPTGRMEPGLRTITTKVTWPTDYIFASGTSQDSIGDVAQIHGPYTVVSTQKVYVQKGLVQTTPVMGVRGRAISVSGRVAGPAEANGSSNFLMKVQIQKLTNGRWTNYTARYVRSNGAAMNKYYVKLNVGSAGTYRAVVSHSDLAHPYAAKASARKVVR